MFGRFIRMCNGKTKNKKIDESIVEIFAEEKIIKKNFV